MGPPVCLSWLKNTAMSGTDIYTLESEEKLFSFASDDWGPKDRKRLSKDGWKKGTKRERIL